MHENKPGNQYKLLELVEKIIDGSKYVDNIEKWTDGLLYKLGESYPTTDSGDTFTIQLDIKDIYNDDGGYRDYAKALKTIIHEYSHTLFLNSDQINYSKRNKDYYYYNAECFRKGSYILDFYNEFWKDIPIDTGDAVYTAHLEGFVNQYASQTCDEDIAESFTMFVLTNKQLDGSICAQKINFFYNYPEMVKIRDHIRSEFGIDC